MRALSLMLIVVPSGETRADQPALPRAYRQVTKDGRFVFVMLAPHDPEELGEKYPDSGLYRNNGSTTPLWRVGWFAYAVHVSSDGKHLVRRGDWPTIGDGGETRAVSFYRDGSEIKTYRVKDLVPDPGAMPQSVSHYRWDQPWVFDAERNRLTIRTLAAEGSPSRTHVFDVATGEIIKGAPPPKANR